MRIPPPTRHGSSATDLPNELLVRAFSLRRIEIDQLNLLVATKARDPVVNVLTFEGGPLPLHQLHDTTSLQIDRGDQHGVRTGDAVAGEKPLQVCDAVFGEMEHRRSQSSVGPTGVEHLQKMVERSSAAGGDHRDLHG